MQLKFVNIFFMIFQLSVIFGKVVPTLLNFNSLFNFSNFYFHLENNTVNSKVHKQS